MCLYRVCHALYGVNGASLLCFVQLEEHRMARRSGGKKKSGAERRKNGKNGKSRSLSCFVRGIKSVAGMFVSVFGREEERLTGDEQKKKRTTYCGTGRVVEAQDIDLEASEWATDFVVFREMIFL